LPQISATTSRKTVLFGCKFGKVKEALIFYDETLKNAIFWDVTTCNLAGIYPNFAANYCHHFPENSIVRL
jgi:hypothetical protein